jgi:D-alanyl-D-alanine carboxypeptidase
LRQATIAAALARAGTPMAVCVASRRASANWSAAAGAADASTGRPLGVDTPLRVASNTKMFVAAATLKLWEQRAIDLDASIATLASPELVALLDAGGYRTGAITVRQLLSHSAGLYDHGEDPRFVETLLTDPSHAWTREEQVRLSLGSAAGPRSEPGAQFSYSDTGYVLLGDILERVTGASLAAAVRQALRLDARQLDSTWWECAEPAPPAIEPRARQFLNGVDMTDANATMDLYGGGGLVMSARDLAGLTLDLFDGRVFEHAGTLEEMLRPGSHADANAYRLGVFVGTIGGMTCYSHAGFWGTVVYYVPPLALAVAGVTTERTARPALVALIEQEIAEAGRSAHAT